MKCTKKKWETGYDGNGLAWRRSFNCPFSKLKRDYWIFYIASKKTNQKDRRMGNDIWPWAWYRLSIAADDLWRSPQGNNNSFSFLLLLAFDASIKSTKSFNIKFIYFRVFVVGFLKVATMCLRYMNMNHIIMLSSFELKIFVILVRNSEPEDGKPFRDHLKFRKFDKNR